MSRRGGLGRGLAALIPSAPEEQVPASPAERTTGADDGPPAAADLDPPAPAPATSAGASGTAGAEVPGTPDAGTRPAAPGAVPATAATYAELRPDQVVPNPRQPREVFDDEELEGLAVSLLDIGMLQPIVVRPLQGDRYELVAGERRLRAARIAGLERVPAVVRHTEDADLLKEALVENIHRVQLNPLEEAAALQQLLEEFGVTKEELGARLGRSRPAISNALRLLGLPSAVQRRVAAGVLSAGHAKALLAIEDPGLLTKLADTVVREGLSVRATEELVRLRAGGTAPAVGSHQPRRPPLNAPGLTELSDDLSDALRTRVRISMGARRGKLVIDFNSVDELERLVAVIASGLERDATPAADVPAS
jgi:ParB family transcriptional regulator, chromosome partitioning protein